MNIFGRRPSVPQVSYRGRLGVAFDAPDDWLSTIVPLTDYHVMWASRLASRAYRDFYTLRRKQGATIIATVTDEVDLELVGPMNPQIIEVTFNMDRSHDGTNIPIHR